MNRLKLFAAVAVLGLPLAACEENTPPPPVGSIAGTVSIEGTGIDGVSVNLSNGNSTTTSGGGSYHFTNVEGGAYTVTISGFPSDATFDATSAAATISSAGQSVTLNFTGAYIRTASVMGTVTVENMGLGGVTVALSGVSSASAVTDDNGQYAFTGLRMGNYSVEISGFDTDEIGFSATAAAVTVGVGESKIISFDGTYLRTAGIMGRVSVEGEGLEGVTVSLAGGPDATDMSTMTDASGQYSFAKLRAGDYAVGISGYNTDDYEFEVTSQNVTVALGETANVPFEGVLLRTSGISGRVSVEGAGLEGVTVTLSAEGAEDMTAMTDAGGLYAFSGLAAGDYTVSAALSEEQMAAYVFESTSMDVTVGDDETAILNFEGTHARTASVSGMLFVDEGTKNDMMDEGEDPLPAPGVPVVLVGPGVNDQLPSATDSTGAFSFMGLRAGNYQLVVSITPAIAAWLGDYAFGGSAVGYPIELDVGEAHTEHLPFDITHTTVHFGVTLKAGETRGAPLPGAGVTLYADAMGETKVGEGMTMVNEETGHAVASIRIARAGTTGNMVHAAVSAEDYDVAAGMQAVPWDPKNVSTMAANDADIVNLNVDVTARGATIATEYGGGDALAGWAIGVMAGDAALEGDDVPAMLDAEGMAAYKTTVDSAGALPVTYTFSVDTIQDNMLDGGENFVATSASYTHTGLALAGTMDAGTMQVRYTTQTLKVYVHHERDQVLGYTGNVLAGDERASGALNLSIRYIDGNGRSRSFTSKEWDPKNASDKDGVYTFAHVPAAANVVVQAQKAVERIMLLDPDELAAYTAMEENGVTGGAFGAMGGFSHTVELCPLKATNPTGQDHGECGSFAFVETHRVTGLIWKRDIVPHNDAFRLRPGVIVAGVGVALDPVPGKNLAGEQHTRFTQAEDNENTAHDDRFELDLGYIAAGAYGLRVSRGWRVRLGRQDTEEKIGDAFSPLDENTVIDVTPAGGILYGYVRGSEGFGIDSVTVTVNDVSVVTDELGRYIARRFGPVENKVFLSASKEGFSATELDSTTVTFAANRPIRHDFTLSGVAKTASISGTVRLSGTNAPVAGASITVDGRAPLNAEKRSGHPNFGKLLTDADGNYSATFPAKTLGSTASASASKAGMTFSPASYPVAAHAGANTSGIAFTGYLHATISGRVVAPGGGPLAGVFISATSTGAAAAADTLTTSATGTFSFSVPFGNYDISASLLGHNFVYPNNTRRVNVGPGQSVSYGDIQARTFLARNVRAVRQTSTTAGVTTYDGQIVVTWDANAAHVPDGYQEATYRIQYATGRTWLNISSTPATDTAGLVRFASPSDGVMAVRVVSTATSTEGGAPLAFGSRFARVSAVDPTPDRVVARRSAQGATADSLLVAWGAVTNSQSEQRLVLRVSVSALGGANVWLETSGIFLDSNSRTWSSAISAAAGLSWTVASDDGSPGQSVTVTAADLLKAIDVRVDARQGSSGDYSPGAVAAVAAKGS